MVNKENGKVLVVKRSCLTGRIVWMYRGASEEAARKAYWRACKKEIRRVRDWTKKMSRRRRLLLSIVTHNDSSSESSSVFNQMSCEKRKLARRVMQIAKDVPQPDREFYDHVVEEAKRRNWASDRWKANRMRMVRYGQTHTEGEYQSKRKNETI